VKHRIKEEIKQQNIGQSVQTNTKRVRQVFRKVRHLLPCVWQPLYIMATRTLLLRNNRSMHHIYVIHKKLDEKYSLIFD